jgi:hypothetical protein
MPSQLNLPLSPVTPTEQDLRTVFERSSLAMSFQRAMAAPAVARCLMAAARARITGRQQRRDRRARR